MKYTKTHSNVGHLHLDQQSTAPRPASDRSFGLRPRHSESNGSHAQRLVWTRIVIRRTIRGKTSAT
eukprot:2949454-Rhodomonas_salina.2